MILFLLIGVSAFGYVSAVAVIVIILNVSLEDGAYCETGGKEECTCVTTFGLVS